MVELHQVFVSHACIHHIVYDDTQRFYKAKAEYDKLQKEMDERKIKADAISGFMFEISELDELPIAFDEKLWNLTVDSVTVYTDERLVFKFKNGTDIEERL